MSKQKIPQFEADPRVFERVLAYELFLIPTARKHHYMGHSITRAKPLLEMGLIEKTMDVGPNYIRYAATPAGLLWWYSERLNNQVGDASILTSYFEGKGIGSELRLIVPMKSKESFGVYEALRAGYLELMHYETFLPYMDDEAFTVLQTVKGMTFFDAVPRIQYECA